MELVFRNQGSGTGEAETIGFIYVLKIEAILLSSLPIHVDNADAGLNMTWQLKRPESNLSQNNNGNI